MPPPMPQHVRDEVGRLCREGWRTESIMGAVGCSDSAVRRVRRRLGIPAPARVPRRRLDHDKVVRLTQEGRSAPEIAVIMGCDPRTVTRIRVEAGVARRPFPRMTPEEVALAEGMLDDGASLGEVGRTLGRTGVHKRWKGRGWPRKDGALAREMFAGVKAIRHV